MSERQAVTVALIALIVGMMLMAIFQPKLWEVELFKSLLQAAFLTGFLNMVLAFHFTANKSDEVKSNNTAKAFDAITATAKAGNVTTEPDVVLKPGETAQAESDVSE